MQESKSCALTVLAISHYPYDCLIIAQKAVFVKTSNPASDAGMPHGSGGHAITRQAPIRRSSVQAAFAGLVEGRHTASRPQSG